MNTKPILAYDCATASASVALRVHGHTYYTSSIDQTRQAADLVPVIQDILREGGVSFDELGAIVTTIGPGSFTGVRIGLAALHGFVLVAKTPIKLLSTIETVAWQVAQTADAPTRFYISLRAGKGEVYAQVFTRNAGTPIAHGKIFLAPETKNDWDAPCFSHDPDATFMCNIAEHLPAVKLADAVPLYIRAPDAIAAAPHAWLAAN